MSIMAAIDLAVTLQLLADGKGDHYADYKYVMGPDPPNQNPVVIRGHGYNPATMETFLQAVAMRLKSDKPALNFDWVAVMSDRCLSANRETLINLIARVTAQLEGGK